MSEPQKQRFFKGEQQVLNWWRSMNASPDELKKESIPLAPTVWRAELKRAASSDAALLTQGFRGLWFRLPPDAYPNFLKPEQKMLAWGAVAGLLSHVRHSSLAHSFAYQLGKPDEKTDKPVVSELRFQQLIASKSPEDFYRRMQRIIQQMKGELPVVHLSHSILDWFAEYLKTQPTPANHSVTLRWAMDYYQAADKASTKNT